MMNRRQFLFSCAALSMAGAGVALGRGIARAEAPPMDVRAFAASRQFVTLPVGRIAYVERGRGEAALFLHGYPLNGYQWRGALSRLSAHRRCLAPDFLGLGYTEVPEGTDFSPESQAAMLAGFLDALKVRSVDIVANDSGSAVAQLFVARHPERVRSLLLTNGDSPIDCPPKAITSMIEEVRKGNAAEKFVTQPLKDRVLARSPNGLIGACFTFPDRFKDETLDCYLGAFAQSPLRLRQFEQFALALEKDALADVEPGLKRFQGPVRILWGMGDTIFDPQSRNWLNDAFPGSRGVREIEGAKLFWPEEFPEVIAEEARGLWKV